MDRMMPFSSHTVIERGTSSTHANCFSTSFAAFSAPSHIVLKQQPTKQQSFTHTKESKRD